MELYDEGVPTKVNSISQFLRVPPKNTKLNKRVSERSALIGYFFNNLKDLGYNFSVIYIGVRLSPLTTEDLHHLKKECDKSKNFGKTFFGLTKPIEK